jgi:hypothetical protein
MERKVRKFHGKKGRKGKERKEGSAAADLQKAGVHAGAGLPTGEEMALIFRCQRAYKQRQQGQEEDCGNLKESHWGKEGKNGLGDRFPCLGGIIPQILALDAASCATSQTVTLRGIVHRFRGLAHCLASPGRAILWKERNARVCAKCHGKPQSQQSRYTSSQSPDSTPSTYGQQRQRDMTNNASVIWATTISAYDKQQQRDITNNGAGICAYALKGLLQMPLNSNKNENHYY